MPLADFIISTKMGLYCPYGDFYLDAQQPVMHALISHAHGDHAISGHRHVYCTAPTMAFMEHRYRKFSAFHFQTYDYRQTFDVNGIRITFFPAGHILGSSLVQMEYKGCTYLYTGDYKREADSTCEPIQCGTADVLITETTFAYPELKHPDAVEEIKKLNTIPGNIMLGAYALGKSQRLTALINEHCSQKRILLHHSILPFTKIYEQFGMPVGKYEPYDRKVMKMNPENLIYIVPPMVFHSYFKAINVVRIFASGWKHLQQNPEASLYISDHVDWQGILDTVTEVNPKEIWTTHGEGKHLQAHFGEKMVVKLLN